MVLAGNIVTTSQSLQNQLKHKCIKNWIHANPPKLKLKDVPKRKNGSGMNADVQVLDGTGSLLLTYHFFLYHFPQIS